VLALDQLSFGICFAGFDHRRGFRIDLKTVLPAFSVGTIGTDSNADIFQRDDPFWLFYLKINEKYS
jgi:hypothetical protein